MMKKLELFASANTGVGFVNNFKYINNTEEYYNFILKGGSGTGKSTLMKRIGAYFEKQGESVEYFYCSSDCNSLDAVHLVDSDIAIIDGTAPHITEATIPKVNSEIVNLGEYIGDKVKNNARSIKKLIQRKSELYTLLYKHLEIAKTKSDILDIYQSKTKDIPQNYYLKVLNKLNLKEKESVGGDRKLFCKCFNTDGIKNLDIGDLNIIKLPFNSIELSTILKSLASKINYLGYQTISLLDIINPDKVEGLIIKDMDTLIVGKKPIYKGIKRKIKLDIDREIEYVSALMSEIRKVHTNLEKYYIKNLDINGLNEEYRNLLCRIINMKK